VEHPLYHFLQNRVGVTPQYFTGSPLILPQYYKAASLLPGDWVCENDHFEEQEEE